MIRSELTRNTLTYSRCITGCNISGVNVAGCDFLTANPSRISLDLITVSRILIRRLFWDMSNFKSTLKKLRVEATDHSWFLPCESLLEAVTGEAVRLELGAAVKEGGIKAYNLDQIERD